MSTKATCSIDGCEKPHHSREWCGMHCERWRAHGDPLWLPPTPADRFWSHVDQYGPDGFHSQTGENLGPTPSRLLRSKECGITSAWGCGASTGPIEPVANGLG